MQTAPSTCRAIKIILLFVVFAQDVLSFVALQAQHHQQPQVARLIKIPLIRDITPGVGTHGQPVVSYYAPVDIGSPAKRFNIQFDVGYADLFIPHYTWNPLKFNLHYGKGYLCKQSSTCVKIDKEFTSNCHSCIITGKPNEDVVSLSSAYKASNASSAPALQLPVSFRQSFLAASDASTGKYRYLPVDGLFGLFSSPQSSTGSLTNPILSLHNAQLIDNLQFSFWFNPVLDSNQGGELVFGGVDTARYQGQIYWHRLVNMDGSWTLNLQQVTLGGQLIGCNQPRCTATTSSWVNEVHGPAAQVQRIYDLLNTVMSADGLPLIDCRRISQMPILTLNIDGIPYSLLPSNYVRKTTDTSNFKTETCYVAILPSEGRQHGNQWVLGTNFMGAYYSTYDLTHRQVGFASLR